MKRKSSGEAVRFVLYTEKANQYPVPWQWCPKCLMLMCAVQSACCRKACEVCVGKFGGVLEAG